MATKSKNEEVSDESGAESLLVSDSEDSASDMDLTESDDGEDDIVVVSNLFIIIYNL